MWASVGCGGFILNTAVQEVLSEKVIFEQRPAGTRMHRALQAIVRAVALTE